MKVWKLAFQRYFQNRGWTLLLSFPGKQLSLSNQEHRKQHDCTLDIDSCSQLFGRLKSNMITLHKDILLLLLNYLHSPYSYSIRIWGTSLLLHLYILHSYFHFWRFLPCIMVSELHMICMKNGKQRDTCSQGICGIKVYEF